MSIKTLALLLAVMAATSVAAVTAHANANRTFVSNTGLAGNTAQNCSAGSPCDTFANALSVTNSGGEINCLNAGDFGAVTISQAVTINCEGVSNGGIAVTSGNAITVNGSGQVNLIGLDISGTGDVNSAGGLDLYGGGAVVVRNCKIHDFPYTAAVGITLLAGTLVVDNVVITHNGTGIFAYDGSGGLNMSVRNSTISDNTNGGITLDVAGGSHAGATIEQTTLAFNGQGVLVENTGAIAIIGGSTIVNNTTGVSATGGGKVYSFKNNQIGGNGTDGTPLTAYPGGPLN